MSNVARSRFSSSVSVGSSCMSSTTRRQSSICFSYGFMSLPVVVLPFSWCHTLKESVACTSPLAIPFIILFTSSPLRRYQFRIGSQLSICALPP